MLSWSTGLLYTSRVDQISVGQMSFDQKSRNHPFPGTQIDRKLKSFLIGLFLGQSYKHLYRLNFRRSLDKLDRFKLLLSTFLSVAKAAPTFNHQRSSLPTAKVKKSFSNLSLDIYWSISRPSFYPQPKYVSKVEPGNAN